MYYQHLILTIFRPLADIQTTHTPQPHQILETTNLYLQTLIRLYYLRHGYEAMDLFIVIPLMLSATDCIDAINAQPPTSNLESLRSTLILTAMGLHTQRRNHYLAEALFRVVRGRMRPAELALFKGVINMDEDETERNARMVQEVRSDWPVSVVKKKDEKNAYVLKHLVDNYAHLNVDDEAGGVKTTVKNGFQY
jgi:hypothetical protein